MQNDKPNVHESWRACTVVSKNYLAQARALARSLAEQHPGARLLVLLADRVDGRLDPAAEPFDLVEIESLKNVPDLRRFLFRYDVVELNTAIKPYLFEWIFDQDKTRKVIFFDPDILIFSPLGRTLDLLDEHSALLTPHLTAPIEPDGWIPEERDMLQSGANNLGFIALSDSPRTREFLHWWQRRLHEHCLNEKQRGYFVDQKWVDLAPGMFGGFHLLREPEYNVAYWNLHERGPEMRVEAGGRPTVRGRPVSFFHFSGYDPDRPDILSKYQDRLGFEDLPQLRPLFDDYARRLREAGHEQVKEWDYAYGRFCGGEPIPQVARVIYRRLPPEERERFGDPFNSERPGSFLQWLNRSSGLPGLWQRRPRISRLWWWVYESRPDLQRMFPDAAGDDRYAFHAWIHAQGTREFGMAAPLLGRRAAPSPGNGAPAPTPRRTMTQRLARARVDLAHKVRRTFDGSPRTLRMLVKLSRAADQVIVRSRMGAFRLSTRGGAVDPRGALPYGVNVAGYLTGEFGVAEASRGFVHALKSAGIPYVLNNVVATEHSSADASFGEFSEENPYVANLVAVNADTVPQFHHLKGAGYYKDRYNIAHWAWETDRFPERWFPHFDPYHEVWVNSTFCADAIGAASPVPVVRIRQPIVVDESKIEGSRAEFDLPEGAAAFYFAFDFHSVFERKNPMAVVEAYRRAFGGSKDAALVLKCINGQKYPQRLEELHRQAEGLNMHIFDQHLRRGQVLGLIRSCDSLVSLHRSEGFGLSLAEAMYLGKVVIATGYSGNMDFMNVNNSLPVRYRMVELTEDYGHYTRGHVWADADVDHAAEQMRWIVQNRDAAARLGEQASQDIRTHYSAAAAGEQIRQRLKRVLGDELAR